MDARILIVEANAKYRHMLRRYVVKGCRGSSVQATSALLEDYVSPESLAPYDVMIVGCDFGEDGTHRNPTLTALRAISADPGNPPVILIAASGSEFTAVQALKSGAFDYVPRKLLDREQIVSAIERALARSGVAQGDGSEQDLQLFGYDIRRCLANSDEGSVHIAFSGEHGREVVLKVLRRGGGSLARDRAFDRFVGEFKLLCDINDPVVAQIYDFRVNPRFAYIAMEYFPLGHLGVRMQRGVSPEEALQLIEEIAHALSIIHAAGIVHLDLKPGNIMLRDDGTAALIDFGISRSKGGEVIGNEVEEEGGVVGTPYYMSPEQANGDATDERSDLYALGIMFYEMLMGSKPFVGDTPTAILDKHRSEPVPGLPVDLADHQPVLDRLLAKDPAQRIGSARELIETIEALRARLQAA